MEVKKTIWKEFPQQIRKPSQHKFTSTKNTFSGDYTNASVKICASFGTKLFFERGNRKLSTCRKSAVVFRKLEYSGKESKNIRMGIWVKNRLSGGPFQERVRHQAQMSEQESELINQEVEAMLRKGAIHLVH